MVMKGFRETDPAMTGGNYIDMIASQWMLVTAGDASHCNTMTASWGGVGEMWGKHMALAVIRPQRHTRLFVDSHDRLTLSFLGGEYQDALVYCGSHSGSDDRNKISSAGLTTALTNGGTPFIAEARLVLECRKMYVGRFREEEFLDKGIVDKMYPQGDFHYTYFCEIEKAFVRVDE